MTRSTDTRQPMAHTMVMIKNVILKQCTPSHTESLVEFVAPCRLACLSYKYPATLTLNRYEPNGLATPTTLYNVAKYFNPKTSDMTAYKGGQSAPKQKPTSADAT